METRGLFFNVLAIVVIAIAVAYAVHTTPLTEQAPAPAAPAVIATSSASVATTTLPAHATTTSPVAKVAVAPVKTSISSSAEPTQAATTSTTNTSDEAVRIQNPYTSPQESTDQVNSDARAALVNILCLSNGSIEPISGSGVIIDPRGVILTNAHVAQYVLLSEDPAIDLSCQIRTGSPAHATWTATVLYIPSVWVTAHASELNTPDPTGTGEHDYALLLINGAMDGGTLPAQFPALPYDARQAIGFTGDSVLVASYPAEFLGGLEAENDLYADTSITNIGQLLTFSTSSVDVISLGGVIEAQTGSSGGAVVNPWGRLIALIATTSEGSTTASRDLRAITLSYINTDLQAQSGSTLDAILQGNLATEQQEFNTIALPGLMKQYIAILEKQQQ